MFGVIFFSNRGEEEGDDLKEGGGADHLLSLAPLEEAVRAGHRPHHHLHHAGLQAEVVEAGEEEEGGGEGDALEGDSQQQGQTHRDCRHEEDHQLREKCLSSQGWVGRC